MEFIVGEFYKTQRGEKVKLGVIDMEGDNPLVGLRYEEDGGVCTDYWDSRGVNRAEEDNLVAVWTAADVVTVPLEGWVNVYAGYTSQVHPTEEQAINSRSTEPEQCILMRQVVAEGENQ